MGRQKLLLLVLGGFVAVWFYFQTTIKDPARAAYNKPAPDVAIHTAAGTRRLSEMKGKVVLVDFWATWCGPCRQAMPAVQGIYKDFHDKGFEVMGVALEHDEGTHIPEAVKEIGVSYPVGMPVGREGVEAYGFNSIPYMVLVDKKGLIRWAHSGFGDGRESELTSLIPNLLAE